MTEDKPLYKPFKSSAKGKKMSVYVMKDGKKRLIYTSAIPICRTIPSTKMISVVSHTSRVREAYVIRAVSLLRMIRTLKTIGLGKFYGMLRYEIYHRDSKVDRKRTLGQAKSKPKKFAS